MMGLRNGLLNKEALGCIGTVTAAIVGGICLLITALPALLPLLRPTATPTLELAAMDPSSLATPVAAGLSTPFVDPNLAPASFFPDAGDIQKDWKETLNETVSNEMMAQQFDDPGNALLLFDSWGRLSGQRMVYAHDDPCDFDGVRSISFSIASYQAGDGAHSGFEYLVAEPDPDRTTQIKLSDVGEEAYLSWFEYQDDCQPADEIRSVSIIFRRYNVDALLYMASLKGSVSDDELLDSIRFFARRIEFKIISNAIKN